MKSLEEYSNTLRPFLREMITATYSGRPAVEGWVPFRDILFPDQGPGIHSSLGKASKILMVEYGFRKKHPLKPVLQPIQRHLKDSSRIGQAALFEPDIHVESLSESQLGLKTAEFYRDVFSKFGIKGNF